MIREIYPPKKVFIKYINQQKGWGVFCSEKILKGEIVEQCYGLSDNYATCALKDYVFSTTPDFSTMDVLHSLGYGAVYNHSDSPNIEFRVLDNIIIEFTAITDIEVGDEIRQNYGPYDPEKKSKFI